MTRNEIFLKRCNKDGITINKQSFSQALDEYEKELKGKLIDKFKDMPYYDVNIAVINNTTVE